jgi:CBS domain-containing protein
MSYYDLTVRTIMIEGGRTILEEAPAARAAQMMVQSRIRHLVVTQTDSEVVGVLSERQILKHFSPWLSEWNDGNPPATPFPNCTVQDVMSKPAITVPMDTPIRSAAALMASKKIGCLPVVRGRKKMAGVVTATDLLKYVGAERLPEPQEELEVFRPPAFVTEKGEITVPVGYFPEIEPEREILAVLAYAKGTKRIGVRLSQREKEEADLFGARPATLTDKYLAIPASDFLKHQNLNIRGPLEVAEDHHGSGFLLLSPVLMP